MLKGYLDCKDIGKFLLGYINFCLSKKDMERVAIHLRNCPKCLCRYTELQNRKRALRKKLIEIEKIFRKENDISAYVDNEIQGEAKKTVEKMIEGDMDYRHELIETENLRQFLKEAQKRVQLAKKPVLSNKIIAKIHAKKRANKRLFNSAFNIYSAGLKNLYKIIRRLSLNIFRHNS